MTQTGEEAAQGSEQPQGRASQFHTGVVWNMGSLAFLAAAGFALNIIVARYYGPDALGVFNICFALYIFFSQFGVFGLHFSILQIVSEHGGRDQRAVDDAVASGFLAALALTTATTVVALASTPLVAAAFDEEGIVVAWLAILPGLWSFSLNKYLYSVINGARHMRTFAALQALRYVLILAALSLLMAIEAPAQLLTSIFSIAELALLPVLFIFARRAVVTWPLRTPRDWTRRHLWFGARVFLSGAILELNTRVDVLIIGVMLDAARAGVYSVALLVAEGVGQLIFALRNNVNPKIARYAAEGDQAGLLAFSRRTIGLFTGFMIVVSAAAYLVYPVFESIVFDDPAYHAARAPLAILLVGTALTAGFMCFNMTLAQANRPGLQTALAASVLIVNAVADVVLVPLYGITGAALGAVTSYVWASFALVVLARQAGLRILA